jgi:lysozyme family protein
MAEFKLAVTKTILREGGAKFTNDLDDPGGPTKYGIAQNYNPGVDVRNLSEAGAQAIYRKEYWDPICGDIIHDQGVAEMLFDAAVNMGVATIVRLAQVAVGRPATGQIDGAAVEAINDAPPHEFAAAFTLAKIARYAHLCEVKPAKKKFFYGWVRRALEGAA